jgi:hypothetical protein
MILILKIKNHLNRCILKIRIKKQLKKAKAWFIYAQTCKQPDIHKNMGIILGEQHFDKAKKLKLIYDHA